jgi:methionyl-tRNA synthetase
MAKFYLTTAIDYSNGDPHLGHALEKIGADCIARYRRLRGDQVHFLMGMDEHAQSVVQAAQTNGVTPQVWVDGMADRFLGFWRRLHCTNDDWIRTTEPRHARAVQQLIERIRARNPDDVYLGQYEGLYCTGCEEFKQGAQIVNGRCVEHPTLELVATREENHFFRLSRYRDTLYQRITGGELRVEPEIRRNEILRLLEAGLVDISISRTRFPWGIPFPGAAGHTVYVWFDALVNYLSATGFPAEGYDRIWPADLHVIGKGITRFHCVIWPAMLLAADLALPRTVWAHGYVQWEGTKMSKTAGTAVSLETAIERHGPDALRYFLLREVGFEGDGDFTWERFDARYTADLADGLGNLASRSLAMIEKYRGGRVPEGGSTALDQAAETAIRRYQAAMDGYDLKGAADRAWELVTAANQFIVQRAPWTLAKEGKAGELDAVLASLVRCLTSLAGLTSPFIPAKAETLWQLLGVRGQFPGVWEDLAAPDVAGQQVRKADGIFPKVPHVTT